MILLLVLLLVSCAPVVIEIPREVIVERIVEREVIIEAPLIAFDLPAPGWISSGFGYRLGYGGQAGFHRGLDIAAVTGTPVRSPIDGVVVEHWPPPGGRYTGHPVYGGAIYIHGGDYLVLVAHLSRSHIREGDTVTRGQVIGEVGSTGWSTGPHLHIEVWVDPTALLRGQIE